MRTTFLSLCAAVLPLAAAFPAIMQMDQDQDVNLEKRFTHVMPQVPEPKFTPKRDNCGSAGPCTTFDAEDQLVKVGKGSGHEWKAPGTNDLRGQCPGLNAAANHGFLPRNGIASTAETVQGLYEAYSMSKNLGAVLAVISIALSGDPIAGTWSIGEGYEPTLGLLGRPTGIAGTHNRYEGDSSIVRGDAYMHKGYVGFFEMFRFERLHRLAASKGGLTHNKVASQAFFTRQYSVLNNPYYFSGPFSGLVAPDAHNFVVNLMSNRSEEHKGGKLYPEVLKSFFSVTGKPGNFKHIEGHERIPFNWYKRPTSRPMTTISTNVDTVVNNQMYPGIISFGGNMGKTNTFTGVDLNDVTGGVFNGANLLKGNNLSCFFLQATQQGLPDALSPLIAPLGELQALLDKTLGPTISALGCPQLKEFNNEAFNSYPGASKDLNSH